MDYEMRSIEFITETKGLPSPGTYEQENDMFKSKGPERFVAMTSEDEDKPVIRKKKVNANDKISHLGS